MCNEKSIMCYVEKKNKSGSVVTVVIQRGNACAAGDDDGAE